MNSANYYHPSYLSASVYKKPLSHNSDESGCEADMADGAQEDDSGDLGSRKEDGSAEAPLNLKSEGSDDSSPPSPDQYPQNKDERMPPQETKVSNATPKIDAKTAEMVQHLLMMNGQHENKMAALQNYQNLQNLCSVNSLVAGLQSLSGLPNSSPLPALPTHQSGLLNTPLNLTMVGTQQLLSPQNTAMPQFVLAGGQMVQGIQGAQLLVPTSQGIVTQTILTIPINHVTSNQVVNLALTNGQVISTTLAQLQNLPSSHNLLSTNPSVNAGGNLLGFNGLPPHQQQLLNAMQQQPHLVSNTMMSGSTKSPVHRTHHSPNKNQSNHATILPTTTSNNFIPHGCSNNALTAISRLAANNSDITITASPAPAHNNSNLSNHFRNRDRSESPISDGCDLLDDSPNEPMISEVQSNVVDGINLDEMKEFAKAFKLRRLSLGLTQTQVGQALSVTEGPAYSQSAICSALATQVLDVASRQPNMFEKLDITPKSAQKIKPVLERWMKEAEERFKSGQNHLTEFIGMEPSKKRKRRTSFTPQALELLNVHFERNTHPSGAEITALAHQLGYEREVIRIWFCNKRQALKNTVRMMSKSASGIVGDNGG